MFDAANDLRLFPSPRVRPFVRTARTALVLLALAACMPENENSVIDRPLANDSRLAGVWTRHAEGEATTIVRIKAETPETLVVDLGVFSDSPGMIRYRAARTRIDGRDILELTEVNVMALTEATRKSDLPKRFFVAYAFDSDSHLDVYLQDQWITPLEKAVAAGRLAGRKERRGSGDITVVTAPTADLRAFVAATPDAFANTPMTFVRIAPPTQ
jgi:hypothetical protein